jgi:hypothetical protein
VERRWDEDGNCTSLAYYLADGSSLQNSQGYAVLERSFDEDGKVIQERCLDAQGELTLCAAGYAIVDKAWDSSGVIAEQYYDTEGRPIRLAAGYAALLTLATTGQVAPAPFGVVEYLAQFLQHQPARFRQLTQTVSLRQCSQGYIIAFASRDIARSMPAVV